MSASTSPRQTASAGYLVSGLLGGLVVLVVGAILLAAGVIDTGHTTKVVRQETLTRPAAQSGNGGRTVADIYRTEGRGVVFIQARGVQDSQSPFGLPQQGTATGSGLVLDKDGYILTNSHVVEGARDVQVRFSENGNDFVPAQVKGRDASSDLAVLKVDPSKAKLRPIPLGDSGTAQVGDPVIAIGNPFGFTRTVTSGIISALQRQIDAPNGFTIDHVIQTDASINPGNSGGPLLDSAGKVIGINSQIATGGGGSGSVGIGFAIPINTAKKLLPKLEKGQKVERPFIGITTAAVTKQLAQDLNLPVKQGALVIDVRKGSPADKAGLRAGRTQTSEGLTIGGDVIVEVAGKQIKKPDDVLASLDGKKPGDEVEIRFYRGRDKKSVKLRLANRPSGGVQSPQQQPNPLIP